MKTPGDDSETIPFLPTKSTVFNTSMAPVRVYKEKKHILAYCIQKKQDRISDKYTKNLL